MIPKNCRVAFDYVMSLKFTETIDYKKITDLVNLDKVSLEGSSQMVSDNLGTQVM